MYKIQLKYSKLNRVILFLLMSLSLLSIMGCANTKLQLDAIHLNCSSQIPRAYKLDTPGTSVLPKNSTVGTLAEKLDEQTANLDIANANKNAILDMVYACDIRNAEIVRNLIQYKF